MKFLRVLKNYYWVQLAIVLIVVGGIGSVVIGFGLTETDRSFVFVLIAFAVLGVLLLFVQLKKLANLFESGRKVMGTVTGSSFYKDRGSISYVYSVEGDEYKGRMAVGKNRETKSFQEGMSVNLLVDDIRFEKSVIEDLLK